MGSPFEAAMAAADAVIGATFGEPIRVTPRVKATNKPPQPDPSRAVRTVRGTFTRAPAVDRLQGVRTGTQLQGMSRVAGAETAVWLEAAQLALLGYMPAAGDLVTLTGRAGAPSYAVATAPPDDLGGVTLTLTLEVVP